MGRSSTDSQLGIGRSGPLGPLKRAARSVYRCVMGLGGILGHRRVARLSSVVVVWLCVLGGCGSGSEPTSWTGSRSPTELREPWTALGGVPLVVEEVPFGAGAMYCLQVAVDASGEKPPEVCTSVFFAQEELYPDAGLVTFVNASRLDDGRALFIAVTASGVDLDLPCGRIESESTELPSRAAVVYGVAATSDCGRLAFEFAVGDESQIVTTSAGA